MDMDGWTRTDGYVRKDVHVGGGVAGGVQECRAERRGRAHHSVDAFAAARALVRAVAVGAGLRGGGSGRLYDYTTTILRYDYTAVRLYYVTTILLYDNTTTIL